MSCHTLNENVARIDKQMLDEAGHTIEMCPSVVDEEQNDDIEYSRQANYQSEIPEFSYNIVHGTKENLLLAEPIYPHIVHRSTSLLLMENKGRTDYNSDASSSRSRSGSQASSMKEHWLKEQLENARIGCPGEEDRFLIPISAQKELITVPNIIRDIQTRDPGIRDTEAAKYADLAFQYAQRLYATLAYVKKGADICRLLDEGVTDKDLPFKRQPDEKSKFTLHRQNGTPIATMENWVDKALEKFNRVQWWMDAPVFVTVGHHVFDSGTILPFVECKIQLKRQGAYSKVYTRKIHHSHHDFYPDQDDKTELLFAVKELFSSKKSEFLKEAGILRALGPRNHPHLIKLLATYEKNGAYHLIFPYANANLREYWDNNEMPSFDRETVLWAMRQMTGIASGTTQIHEFQVTRPLLVPGALDNDSNYRSPGNVHLRVKEKEERFGRHGDIKPENVLWFNTAPICNHVKGILQIADFGLGRFHGRESRSGVSKNVAGSPTYEPPECKLSLPVSRKYDIWSLGCLYLEFITWILRGTENIEGFSDFRGHVPTGHFLNDDCFYTITDVNGVKEAEVKEEVKTWVKELHAHEKCSPLIHDLLNLVMEELLVIAPDDRSPATWLFNQLKLFLHKAERDDEYLLKSEPIPLPTVPLDTTIDLYIQDVRPKKGLVTFESLEDSRPRNNTQPKSQPIISRSDKGSPVSILKKSMTSHRINHTTTWPDITVS